ncbi:PfkB family carbohydrate kinase [Prolixibacter sp. SD074]|uniref:PfkB family carbohydrate kinase n=1 Tax=Prolixibacter sp. SD074 TaxID=2652391 RepID=UPI00128A56F1|nr:PfkB family carbohydrate kinase [Prolixibacter sp. SD074]GET29778.1 hypothetical protein SD074_19800 [Prolixibacter sp. SD074]
MDKKVVTFGEIMLRLAAPGYLRFSQANVAVSQGAADVLSEGIGKANEMGVTVSCDLNYRKNLWKYGKTAGEVMPDLVAGTDVVLGNEEDAEMVLGIKPEGVDVTGGHVSGAAYESVSKQIMAKFPRVKKVFTTLRGSISANHNSWSGVLWNGKELFGAPTYQITHIVDRVGGGDSFMGGPSFVKAIKGPCPWISLMPTGGVETTEESLKAWFGAGVTCVGMGSQLITKEIIHKGNYSELTNKVKQVFEILDEIRE